MNQIFILGASTVYGVGGKNGGWADMLKRSFHQKMYAPNGLGETFEVFDFGKSGASIEFVLETFPQQFADYKRSSGTTVALVSVGGNNAKAIGEPGNYVSTIEEYSKQMSQLLDLLVEKTSYVFGVGSGYYNESKVSPVISPFSGKKSYFSNKRKKLFEAECKRLCEEKKLTYIGMENIDETEWLKKYTYEDGLHPNDAGYKLIHDRIWVQLEKIFPELR